MTFQVFVVLVALALFVDSDETLADNASASMRQVCRSKMWFYYLERHGYYLLVILPTH